MTPRGVPSGGNRLPPLSVLGERDDGNSACRLDYTHPGRSRGVHPAGGRHRLHRAPSAELTLLTARVRELEEEVIRLKNSDPYRVGLPAGADPLRSGQGRG